MNLGDRPARQWAVVDALTGGAGCIITTKGLTGTFEKCRSDMLAIRVLTLDEPWAKRRLALCVRSPQALSPVARQLVAHLTNT